jgi:hypothetical protein
LKESYIRWLRLSSELQLSLMLDPKNQNDWEWTKFLEMQTPVMVFSEITGFPHLFSWTGKRVSSMRFPFQSCWNCGIRSNVEVPIPVSFQSKKFDSRSIPMLR